MRIAFFSPLPPEPTGIGDYSYELLEELRELIDVTVAVRDDRLDNARAPDGVEIVGCSSVLASHFDASVYQMGNNPKYHRFVFDRALEEPGLLVMHDPSLADYLAELCGGAESSIFRDEVTYDSPDIGPEDDLPLVDVGDGTKNLDRLRVLLARRIVTSNVRTLVNSEAMATEMRRRYPGNDIRAIQLPGKVITEDDAGGRRDSAAVQFGVFGGINYYKRIRPTVDAFIEHRRTHPDSRMVVAGRADDRLLTAEIRRIAARDELAGALEVKTDLTLPQLEQEMVACDVAISLRWPTAGEMSATLMRCLGAGRPAVVSDVLQFRELDDRFCWRVPVAPSEAEAAALLEIMERAAADPAHCRLVGLEAREFVAREANYEAVARRYVEHLEDCIPRLPAARTVQRPISLDRTRPLGVNITTLDRDGESLEYARRLADALGKEGIDACETRISAALLPDRASPEWDRKLTAGMSPNTGVKSDDNETPDHVSGIDNEITARPIRFGPHEIDLFVVGEREAEEFGYLSRLARQRGHDFVPVVAPSWVPLPSEFSSLVSDALEIWVPGDQAADALRVGSSTPVRALPPLPPTDVVVTQPPVRTPCRFIVHFDGHGTFARQNPWASIAAFRAAFAPKERGGRATLVVVARHFDERSEGGRRLSREVSGVSGELLKVEEREQVQSHIAGGDVFVSLHRSEAFGTHLLDAMAVGRPVIATDFVGVRQYLSSRSGCLVGYSVREADTGDYYLDANGPSRARRGECWAEPDVEQAARWMRSLAASPRLRRELGNEAAATMCRLSVRGSDLFQHVGSLVRDRIERLAREKRSKEEGRRRLDAFLAEFAVQQATTTGATWGV